MKEPANRPEVSRRQFVGRLARGSVLAGAGAVSAQPLFGAERNPFAYDVSHLAKTNPALIAWEEVGRTVCPGKGPRRIAIGPDDSVYVAVGNQIVRLPAEGGSGKTIDAGAAVNCVAVSKDGRVYAGLRDHIEVFDAEGRRQAAWPVQERRTWYSSLALGTDALFAADSGNRVVVRYDLTGKVVARIGAKDPAQNTPGFVVPSPNLDVKLHADGLLRVTNPGRHRFEAYTVDGHFEMAWGQPTAAIEGFCGCCNPIGLALLPDGRTITCEKGLPRVKVYGADGQFESVVAGTESFAANWKSCADPRDCTRGGLDAAVDTRGRIHILDRVTAEIRVFQPKKGRA